MKAAGHAGCAGACCAVVALLTMPFDGAARVQEIPPAEKEPTWRRIDQSEYVGAEKCAECHLEHYVP